MSTRRGAKSAPPPQAAVSEVVEEEVVAPAVVAPVAAPVVAPAVVAPVVEAAEADEGGEEVEDGVVGVEDGGEEAEGLVEEPEAPQGRVTRGQASGGAPAGPAVPAAPKPRTSTVYRPAKDNEKAQAIWARMAELKKSFRVVARVVRPALNDMGNRTMRQLKADETYHEQRPEFEEVQAELDRRLEEEIARINALYDQKIEKTERETAATKHNFENEYQVCIETLHSKPLR
jgi:hypothetical protein